MKITAVIAEYNPYHNGHAHMVSRLRARGTTHTVAVMSGNFTQRGEPALFCKYARARAAVNGGIDLVVELPLPFAISGAERFAYGGVYIADALGCVDELAFGSESGDTRFLSMLAGGLDSRLLYEKIRLDTKSGRTFAAARQAAVGELMGKEYADALALPNNILGTEYIRRLTKLGSHIAPVALERMHVSHDGGEEIGGFASASRIRELVGRSEGEAFKFVPEYAEAIYRAEIAAGRVLCADKYDFAALAVLKRMSAESFAELPDVSEGLENRIQNAVRSARSLEHAKAAAKSKRYTLARIRRIMLAGFLGVDASLCELSPAYIRVLAFGPKGRELLAAMRTTAALPVGDTLKMLEKTSPEAKRFAQAEYRAGELYALCGRDPNVSENEYNRPAERVLVPGKQI